MGDTKKAAAHKGHATANNVQENNNTCTDNKSIFDGINLEPFGEWSLLETFINSFSKGQQEQSFKEMPFVKTVIQESIKEFMQDPQGFIKRVDKEKLFKFLQENRAEFDTNLYNAITVFCGHELKTMSITWNNKHLHSIQMEPHLKGLTKGQREKINRFLDILYTGGKIANWRTTTNQFYNYCLHLFERANYEDENHELYYILCQFCFKISDYFKERKGIDFDQLSKDQVFRYRATFKKDADLIENTILEIAEKKTDKHNLRLLSKVIIKGDRCKIIFDDELAQYIVDHKKMIHYHPALDRLTNSEIDQGAWRVGFFINERTENYGTNKKYSHKAKIKELIKRLGITYDSKKQSWSRQVKQPFENHMNALVNVHFLTSWHYIDPFTGEKIESKDIKTYADFMKMSIYFEVDFREIERKTRRRRRQKTK